MKKRLVWLTFLALLAFLAINNVAQSADKPIPPGKAIHVESTPKPPRAPSLKIVEQKPSLPEVKPAANKKSGQVWILQYKLLFITLILIFMMLVLLKIARKNNRFWLKK